MDPNVPTTINGTDIQNSNGAFVVPEQAGTAGEAGVDAILQSNIAQATLDAQQAQQGVTTAESGVKTAQTTEETLLQQLLGETPERMQLEEQAGIPIVSRELSDLQALATQQTADYLRNLETIEGKAISEEGQAVGLRSLNRQRGIDALLTSSLIQAKQGRLTAAQATVDRALAAKYDPIRQRLQIQSQIIERNMDSLTRADKKLAEAKLIANKAEESRLNKLMEDEKGVQDVALTISQYGGDPSIVKDAKTKMEAIQMAGSKLQNPVTKLEIQKLKNEIYQQELERDILERYGGLSPEQWAKAQEEDLVGLEEAKRTERDLTNQENQINTILNNTAINTVVGPTRIARGTGRKGIFPLIGIGDALSGEADNLVALTEQMLSQQFLDKLITVKGQGATFGALSDREGNSLRSAANAIAQTAIQDKNGNTKGYDMSEAEFKRQFGIMMEAIQVAKEENQGKVLSNTEEAELDSYWQDNNALLAPNSYYQ